MDVDRLCCDESITGDLAKARDELNRALHCATELGHVDQGEVAHRAVRPVEHEKVRKNPSPSPFFLGFGDSSLDFRLLAWTNIDSRLTVESELNVSINSKYLIMDFRSLSIIITLSLSAS